MLHFNNRNALKHPIAEAISFIDYLPDQTFSRYSRILQPAYKLLNAIEHRAPHTDAYIEPSNTIIHRAISAITPGIIKARTTNAIDHPFFGRRRMRPITRFITRYIIPADFFNYFY